MIGTYKTKALAVPSLFNIAIIALLAPVTQAHEHDTSKIPEGESVSLEPLVRFEVAKTWSFI
jgi:hypothetical protein